MPEHEIECFFSNAGTRNEIRMSIVNVLSEEEAGQGKDELASRYTYFVETLADGNRIYLRRPANLHNGFDFIVCLENYFFNEAGERRRNYPKHEDIINDIAAKKATQPDEYPQLFEIIRQVYLCNEIDDEVIRNLHLNYGFSCEMIAKTLKWLFIEQDIRYWNYSGRDMLWDGIPRP